MDDSKSLHGKWLFHKTSTKNWLFGLLGHNHGSVERLPGYPKRKEDPIIMIILEIHSPPIFHFPSMMIGREKFGSNFHPIHFPIDADASVKLLDDFRWLQLDQKCSTKITPVPVLHCKQQILEPNCSHKLKTHTRHDFDESSYDSNMKTTKGKRLDWSKFPPKLTRIQLKQFSPTTKASRCTSNLPIARPSLEPALAAEFFGV